ncbi:MAG: hypothetical protein C0622_02075 [Desulfuromonas sp.]|nr:MAG: hypothetical protein C0622_02075 [Desulfuromonas sp.]
MQNELNIKCIEVVKIICDRQSVSPKQLTIQSKDDFIEIKIRHRINPERRITISTENEEILLGIEMGHLHFPEHEAQDNIPDLISALSNTLDKYMSGYICSYAANLNEKALGGGYTTHSCEIDFLRNSFPKANTFKVCRWNENQIKKLSI